MVHNVFVWQKEKTICVRNQNPLNLNLTANQQLNHSQNMPAQHQAQQTPISTISSSHPIHSQHHMHSHLYQNQNGKLQNMSQLIQRLFQIIFNSQQKLFANFPIILLLLFFLFAGILNPTTHLHLLSHHHHNNNNNPSHANHNHTPLTHTSQLSHNTPVTPITPLSANHSHLFLPGLRPATATPPTPKTHLHNVTANNSVLIGREVSGSITPGTANGTGPLDISNITSTISPHELSTLV